MTRLDNDGWLKERIEKLGPEFGPVFHHAHSEWCDLWVTWRQFESLFGRNEERVHLLNEVAGGFFSRVERHFSEAVILALCRLTDPETTGHGKRQAKNLTVRRFPAFMQTEEQRSHLQQLVETAIAKTEFCVERRHKKIAHNDLPTKIEGANFVNALSRRAINEAIASLYEIFYFVYKELLSAEIARTVTTGDSEYSLLYTIFAGKYVQKSQLIDMKAGNHDRIIQYPDWLQKIDPEIDT